MAKNDISLDITEEKLEAMVNGLKTIKETLPELITLTKDERKGLLVLGDKTVEFVTKATDYAEKNSEFVPGFVDMTEQQKDVTAVNRLKEFQRQMEVFMETLNDSILLAGSEAYNGGLAIYQTVKLASKNNVEGAKTAYDDLRSRFPGRPKSRAPEPETEPAG